MILNRKKCSNVINPPPTNNNTHGYAVLLELRTALLPKQKEILIELQGELAMYCTAGFPSTLITFKKYSYIKIIYISYRII